MQPRDDTHEGVTPESVRSDAIALVYAILMAPTADRILDPLLRIRTRAHDIFNPLEFEIDELVAVGDLPEIAYDYGKIQAWYGDLRGLDVRDRLLLAHVQALSSAVAGFTLYHKPRPLLPYVHVSWLSTWPHPYSELRLVCTRGIHAASIIRSLDTSDRHSALCMWLQGLLAANTLMCATTDVSNNLVMPLSTMSYAIEHDTACEDQKRWREFVHEKLSEPLPDP